MSLVKNLRNSEARLVPEVWIGAESMQCPWTQRIPLPSHVLGNQSNQKSTWDQSQTSSDRNLIKKEHASQELMGNAASSEARRARGGVITLPADIILSPLQANFITQFSLSPRTATAGPWLHLYPQAPRPLTLRFGKSNILVQFL